MMPTDLGDRLAGALRKVQRSQRRAKAALTRLRKAERSLAGLLAYLRRLEADHYEQLSNEWKAGEPERRRRAAELRVLERRATKARKLVDRWSRDLGYVDVGSPDPSPKGGRRR